MVYLKNHISIILKKFIIFLCVILSFYSGNSQEVKVDSLLKTARNATTLEKQVSSYTAASWALIDIDLAKAIACNDSAFNISQRHNYKPGIIDSYYKYVVLNRALGNYDKALAYLNEYEKLTKDDTLKLANVAFQRGVINCIKGNIDEGLKSYHKTLQYYELLNHKKGLGITYNVIGMAYSNMKRYDKSIINYEKSIEILKSIDDIDALASTYHNLANVYDYKHEHDKALGYFKKSIELSEKTSNIRRIAQAKQNMGSIYKKQKSYSKAASITLEAYNILNENKYKGELTGCVADLAEIYTLMGHYKKSEHLLKNQLDSLKGSVKDQAKLYFSLYKLYETSGKPKEALHNYKTYNKLSDSIINENGLKNLNQLQVKFNIENKDKKILEQRLAIENQESQLQKKQSQYKFMTGLVIFLLLVSILTWFLFQQRQKRKTQEILTLKREHQIKTLEALIAGEEKERFRIAKELHDGVNGDLSAIKYKLSSLFEMNNKVIIEAIAMIDNSCKQVRAISHDLVPPSLENFNLVEATEVHCSNLNDVNPVTEIVFQHLGEDINIPKKAEINLFRIIQELITNSIRHAEASKINVQISSRKNTIQITVEDDGKGFDKENVKTKGIGLSNLQSRIDYLNATVDFISNQNGTSYTIEIDTTQLNDD